MFSGYLCFFGCFTFCSFRALRHNKCINSTSIGHSSGLLATGHPIQIARVTPAVNDFGSEARIICLLYVSAFILITAHMLQLSADVIINVNEYILDD